jgi:hypothetical protein
VFLLESEMPAYLNLENAVGSRKSAQAIDSSSYMKKVLITNKVTTHFFITLSKSIACTSFSRPTAFSRLKAGSGRIKACEVYAKASAATNADSSKK